MKYLGVTAVLALSYAPLVSSMESGPGQATCEVDARNSCRIAWNLSQSPPKSSYRVQRFEPIAGMWVTEQESFSPSGVADNPATPGHLYRVVGCNHDSAADCVTTSVYWSPVMPDSADDIPATIYSSDGSSMGVSKSLPLRTQVLQYNVYLFVQVFGNVDMTKLPPMTEPPASLENRFDVVHWNVYPNYKGYRETALGIAQDGPGPERPEARVIHPDERPEHTHDQ